MTTYNMIPNIQYSEKGKILEMVKRSVNAKLCGGKFEHS
jgi:hypothetical protein